ncbi:MAG: ABC transporter permease [Deltaproteobacteria bacterium]|nr:ABC transporter permease [Deltaproteobacteria bacterium]
MDALLDATLRLAAPLLLAALGELIVERAGVVNVGIEGMMLCGAFAAFAASVVSGHPAVGVCAGVAAACAMGALFAVFAVLRRADQIVVGTAINLLALGATGLGLRAMFPDAAPAAPTVSEWRVPGLADLPLLGPSLFHQTPFTYAALVLAALCAAFLARTRAGLRLRAVGDAARAADAEGVLVQRVRVVAVLAGASLAGLAGAALPLAQSNGFTEGMTAGRGFIALAIVIFGRWSAFGVTAAALFFGAATAFQFRLQARGLDVPYPLALALPYVVTLAVLAVAGGRARAPEDLGRPYRRESK